MRTYVVGVDTDMEALRLGDKVIKSDGTPVNGIAINNGFVHKQKTTLFSLYNIAQTVMRQKSEISLTKEEIEAIYDFMKKQEGI